jgi:predicted PhzF superfamily epimerase YddE/YHI9
MEIPIFQVDAFTSKVFGGNPAAVCPLKTMVKKNNLKKYLAKMKKMYIML